MWIFEALWSVGSVFVALVEGCSRVLEDFNWSWSSPTCCQAASAARLKSQHSSFLRAAREFVFGLLSL